MALLEAARERGVRRRIGNAAAAERGSGGARETRVQDLRDRDRSRLRKSGHESCPSWFLDEYGAKRGWRLLGDKSDLAGVTGHRLQRLGRRIDPVDAAEEPRLRIAGVLKILVGPHDLGRIDGMDDVGRHGDQKLRLVALIVPRAKQR